MLTEGTRVLVTKTVQDGQCVNTYVQGGNVDHLHSNREVVVELDSGEFYVAHVEDVQELEN